MVRRVPRFHPFAIMSANHEELAGSVWVMTRPDPGKYGWAGASTEPLKKTFLRLLAGEDEIAWYRNAQCLPSDEQGRFSLLNACVERVQGHAVLVSRGEVERHSFVFSDATAQETWLQLLESKLRDIEATDRLPHGYAYKYDTYHYNGEADSAAKSSTGKLARAYFRLRNGALRWYDSPTDLDHTAGQEIKLLGYGVDSDPFPAPRPAYGPAGADLSGAAAASQLWAQEPRAVLRVDGRPASVGRGAGAGG